LPRALLGRHVTRRADDVAVHRHQRRARRALVGAVGAHDRARRRRLAHAHVVAVGLPEHARETPVHHVGLAQAPDHDVGGLEVAVHDALLVRERDRLAHLEQHAERARAVPSVLALARELEHLLQLEPLDEPHREVDAPVGVDPELVHRHDAGVLELAGDLGFLEEALEHARGRGIGRLRALAAARERDLHGERAAQVRVPHAQDRAHAAARDLALGPVALGRASARCDAAPDAAARVGAARRWLGGLLDRLGRMDRRTGGSLAQPVEQRAAVGSAQPALVQRAELAREFWVRAAQRLDVHCALAAHHVLDEQPLGVAARLEPIEISDAIVTVQASRTTRRPRGPRWSRWPGPASRASAGRTERC
jgi:hypothetical protein